MPSLIQHLPVAFQLILPSLKAGISRPMQESLHPPLHGCQSRCCSPQKRVSWHSWVPAAHDLAGASTMPAASVAGTEWLLSMMSVSPVNTSKTSFSTGNMRQHSFWFLVPSIRTGVVSSAVEQAQIHTNGWKNLHILLESLSYIKWNRNKAAEGKWDTSRKDKVLSLLEERLQLPLPHSCQSRFNQPC